MDTFIYALDKNILSFKKQTETCIYNRHIKYCLLNLIFKLF